MFRTTEKFRRCRFNMVEIALALAVLTLGISAILALFPVGLNSGRAAIAENNLADAASDTLGIYRAYMMNDVLSRVDPDTGAIVAPTKTFANWKAALVKPGDTDNIDWSDDTANPKLTLGGIATNLRRHSDTILCYEQTSVDDAGNEIVDFAAVVRVWADDIPLKFRDWTGDDVTNPTEAPATGVEKIAAENYGLRVYLELSWPVNAALAEREKRLYVMDLYNPQKQVTAITGGTP